MGLDMYLSKKSYVKQWEHNKPEDQFEVSVKKGGVTYPNIQSKRISYVEEELMYWRKANQIHGWFVSNTNEIVEDVRYTLDTDNLKELLETCKQVMDVLNTSKKKTTQVVGGWKNGEEYMEDVEVYDDEATEKVQQLLPPVQGFFFGSYEIDEWYKQNIEDTIKFLEEELPNCSEYDEFEYYASW